ncbi:hypothetical protein [Brevibacillus nitrificans]|uniref:hypothetical protein n=1 Tax=Brevibacillus nitrificans TaxID=651560 RepID=UPI0028605DFB|nr:hypothetical protein [Brevibacillus nitrificans]MDR7315158.1 hypothetical protein [Brevibacillus nitrificans]
MTVVTEYSVPAEKMKAVVEEILQVIEQQQFAVHMYKGMPYQPYLSELFGVPAHT